MKKTRRFSKTSIPRDQWQIFKIQLPLATNDPQPKALVYNADRSIESMWPITQDLLNVMAGEVKRFFYCTVTAWDDTSDDVDLVADAPWQDW